MGSDSPLARARSRSLALSACSDATPSRSRVARWRRARTLAAVPARAISAEAALACWPRVFMSSRVLVAFMEGIFSPSPGYRSSQGDRHGPVHRHHRHRVLRRALDQTVGIREVHQRVPLRIHHAHNAQALENQAGAFAEDLFLQTNRLGNGDGADL